jgi:small subunit ribosomal protein S3
MARQQKEREGRVPLSTLRAYVDYGTAEAQTAYGVIGVKVWIYKGDVEPGQMLDYRFPLGGMARNERGGGDAFPAQQRGPRRGGPRRENGPRN